MKTITEYRPLIFGELIALSEKRKTQRRKWNRSGAGIAAHSFVGLWLFLDTGLAPWNWQFWMVFGPLFIAGELAARELWTRLADRKASPRPSNPPIPSIRMAAARTPCFDPSVGNLPAFATR